MAIDQNDFIGGWRQIDPDASPASIIVTFQPGGRMFYAIEEQGPTIELAWRIEGSTLTIEQPGSLDQNVSQCHFESQSILVMEYEHRTFIYHRCRPVLPSA